MIDAGQENPDVTLMLHASWDMVTLNAGGVGNLDYFRDLRLDQLPHQP